MYYPIPTFMVTQESLSTSTEMLCCLLTSYISLNSQLGTISPHHGLAALSETFWFVPTERGGGGECYWHRARRGQGAIRHPTVRRKAPCDEHLPVPVSTVPRLGNPHVACVHSRPPSPAAVTVMALGVAQRSATLSNLCG